MRNVIPDHPIYFGHDSIVLIQCVRMSTCFALRTRQHANHERFPQRGREDQELSASYSMRMSARRSCRASKIRVIVTVNCGNASAGCFMKLMEIL